MLRATALFAMVLTLIAFAQPARAQDPQATQCPVPNADARVINAVPAVTPPLALSQKIGGEVVVLLSLDENSHLVSAVISRTPSAILNNAALQSARASTFQTRIVNCHPVADQYRFIVEFNVPGMAPPPLPKPPSISDYFLGTWYCASENKAKIVKTYALTSGGLVLTLDNGSVGADDVVSLSQETYTEAQDVLSMRSLFQGALFVGTSPGWRGNDLVFTGAAVAVPVAGAVAGTIQSTRRSTYTRVDANHFIRTFDYIPAGQTTYVTVSRESCARIAKPANAP